MNQYTNGKYDQLGNAIKKYVIGKPWTYVRGFINIDNYAIFSCNLCGHEQSISFISFRHHPNVKCKNCEQVLKARKEEEKLKAKEIKKKELEDLKMKRLRERPVIQQGLSFCGCGNFLGYMSRRKLCEECSKNKLRIIWNTKEQKRRVLIKNSNPDWSITLDWLYKRDNGVCQICGNLCNKNDFEIDEKGNQKFYGGYPSIDHIVPLAKGGKHQKNNVQLAHISCNSSKGASLIPS